MWKQPHILTLLKKLIIDHKFKIDDIVRISKYRNISAKATLQIGPKTFLWLKIF